MLPLIFIGLGGFFLGNSCDKKYEDGGNISSCEVKRLRKEVERLENELEPKPRDWTFFN